MIRVRLKGVTCLLVAVLAVWPRAAAAQQARTYTLDEIQQLAAGYYQAVGIARAQVDQARQGQRTASGARLPTIASQGVLTRNVLTASLEFQGFKVDILPAYDYTFTLSAVQPIFMGYRLQKGLRQAELGVAAAQTSLGMTVQDTVLAATRAYYGVLGAQENVEISGRAVAVAQETLRTATSLYNAGETVETSVLRARVAESDARRELLVAENTLVLARQQLALLTGLTGDFQVARPPDARPLETPVEQLVTEGLAVRPELKALALQKQIASLEIEKRRAEWYPTVQAQALYQKRKATFPSSQSASVAVNAAWSIFDGNRRDAAIASARVALREAELQEELVRRQTAEQIRAAHVAMVTLGASVDLLRTQVEIARRNADETGKAYKVGEATDLDVLQANTAAAQSERQLALTTFQLAVAVCDLQRAVGTFAADLAPGVTGGHE